MQDYNGTFRVTNQEMDRIRREAIALRSRIMREFTVAIIAGIGERIRRLRSQLAGTPSQQGSEGLTAKA